MRTAMFNVFPFAALLLGGCSIFDGLEPDPLAYSARMDVITANPTKIRVFGVVTNTGSKAVTFGYGACSVGLRATSERGGSEASTYELDPRKSVCSMEAYLKTLNAGESAEVGGPVAVLSGNVPAGRYEVTVFVHVRGEPEASAGIIDVH